MNKKGFTLVELIAVIALLGLIITITTTYITNSRDNAKEAVLNTKIKNIEKAAVLYGQDKDNKKNFEEVKNSETSKKYCFENGVLINDCEYYKENNSYTITVQTLIDKDLINTDTKDDNLITNPTNTNNNLNNCEIQIYRKYGKVYAVFDKNTPEDAGGNTQCGGNGGNNE